MMTTVKTIKLQSQFRPDAPACAICVTWIIGTTCTTRRLIVQSAVAWTRSTTRGKKLTPSELSVNYFSSSTNRI